MARDWATLGLLAFGVIEITIGLCTIVGLCLSLVLPPAASPKSVEVFLLVFCMALVSCTLGLGLLKTVAVARWWLIFFSAVVLNNKLLILSGVLVWPGAMQSFIPERAKDVMSALFHLSLIIFLSLPRVRDRFRHRHA